MKNYNDGVYATASRARLSPDLVTVFAIIAVAVGVTGCAWTTDYIAVEAQNTESVLVGSDAQNAHVTVQILDARVQSRLPGRAVGSKGVTDDGLPANILLTEDVVDTVRRPIESNLRARGVTVDTAGGTRLVVHIQRFRNDFETMTFTGGSAVAHVDFSAAVTHPSETVPSYSVAVMGRGRKDKIQLASGENAKAALDMALSDALQQLFADQTFLLALSEQAPTKPALERSAAIGSGALPSAVQADLLAAQLLAAVKANKPEAVLAAVNAYKTEGSVAPPSVSFMEAKAAAATGDPKRALSALTDYLKRASREDTFYQQALSLYPEYERQSQAAAAAVSPGPSNAH